MIPGLSKVLNVLYENLALEDWNFLFSLIYFKANFKIFMPKVKRYKMFTLPSVNTSALWKSWTNKKQCNDEKFDLIIVSVTVQLASPHINRTRHITRKIPFLVDPLLHFIYFWSLKNSSINRSSAAAFYKTDANRSYHMLPALLLSLKWSSSNLANFKKVIILIGL